ncbi:hypothetical protein DFH08DRAFT_993725 [Mycena albidolilacea]|uniref:Uncharacterized protein n=1 Tax=Mycena albidolilacea TaxID=1033008 RepID=A0AAD6YY49_9AGAR|nr:hypothetical protein DFH08DRAFT_993725 [Mycena albidolilacea]
MTSRAGTLRSGKEFSPHGPILLHNFDILQHHVAHAKPNLAETPWTITPSLHLPGSPRRSVRLAPPVNKSIDRAARTRAAHRANEQIRSGTPLKLVVRKHIANARAIDIHTTPDDYPVTSTGWSGIRNANPSVEPREYTVAELVRDHGMSVLPWDGCLPRPLVDKEDRVVAVLGGRPNDDKYLRLTQDAAAEIERARVQLRFRPEQQVGRRGDFYSASVGPSFGGGQQVPGNLVVSRAISDVFRYLFAMECFFRIAGFANGLFRAWNPSVHMHYATVLDTLTHEYPDLRRNFERRFSAFAAATINFGPSTVTLPHIDALNLAWAGGHLVLWDLRLIIRFPPGSTILIPSALLRHSNIGIGPNERRYSFTQYSAAGLFRWVDNGFRTDRTVEEEIQGDSGAQAERAEARRTRWAMGINSFRRLNGTGGSGSRIV